MDKINAKHPEWSKHIDEIKKADYKNHPIILIGDTVVDGMHRLTKAWIDGVDKVKVRRFKSLPETAIMYEKK